MENIKTTKANLESKVSPLEEAEEDLRGLKRSNAEYISSNY